MKTFNQLTSDALTISNDSSGTTLMKTLLNIGCRKVLALSDYTFNKDSKTISTGTGIMAYDPPYNMLKMDYVSYSYGSPAIWYTPKEIKDGETWRRITSVPSVTSSIPEFWFVSNRTHKIEIYPASADSSGSIKMGFIKKIRDFSMADYSTGSASVSANGTIFNTSTGTWTDKMVGRFIKVSNTDTPIDDFWFEITGISSTGTAYVKEVAPNAVSGGSYTIAEMIPLPDGFEDTPLLYALSEYYGIKEKPVLAREYERKFKEDTDNLEMRDSRSVVGLIKQEEPFSVENPSYDSQRMGIIS